MFSIANLCECVLVKCDMALSFVTCNYFFSNTISEVPFTPPPQSFISTSFSPLSVYFAFSSILKPCASDPPLVLISACSRCVHVCYLVILTFLKVYTINKV